ncbi:hypothetical protein MKW94_026179 [Papaver nudicaule]|uniref:C3H1-type domain-containing protein n=1 Tax=Papaver nudicaule TaxID=74823 RepID=A0AA42B3W5_PAPNU|nr:hypothetical protein [Papaver nudicaule]
MEKKNDSSKSRESNSSSSMNSEIIDYYTPIRTQRDFVEFYSSTSPPNHKSSSSSSGVKSRFSSQNSSNHPPKSLLCNSVYLTPPSSSSSTSHEEKYQISKEDRLYLTRVILLYDQLMDQYGLCYSYLKDSSERNDILSQENAALRLINKDLQNQLNLLTESFVNLQKNQIFPSLPIIKDFSTLSIGDHKNGIGTGTANGGPTSTKNNNRVAPSREAPVTSPTSVFGNNGKGFDEKPVKVQLDRVSLPKSISIRSSAYLKMNQLNRLRVSSAPFVPGNAPQVQQPTVPAVDDSKKAGVDGKKKEEVDPLELDVYNQGMSKTELCNKWQQTGECPYGVRCQFAHGVRELRPVIRHPRYKTEVCRMVLTGDFCPYGHRCHFRHALTDQEKLTGRTTHA